MPSSPPPPKGLGPWLSRRRYCPNPSRGDPISRPPPTTWQGITSVRTSAHDGVSTPLIRGVIPLLLSIAALTPPGRALMIDCRNCGVSTYAVEGVVVFSRNPSYEKKKNARSLPL